MIAIALGGVGQKLAFAVKVVDAVYCFPTNSARVEHVGAKVPAVVGLTLKHTVCAAGWGSPLVWMSLKVTVQEDPAEMVAGLHTTFSCGCGLDDDWGWLAGGAARTLPVPNAKTSAPPPIVNKTARAERTALRRFTARPSL